MLYIHIPYCKSKCLYCNFYSLQNLPIKRYLNAIALELIERLYELQGDFLSSIYIGGGTPSLIPAEEFKVFFELITKQLHSANIHLSPDIEITIEANPEDITAKLARTWKECGVNRVSMGIQTLNERELKGIKRRHTAVKAKEALKILQTYFENISVDIIYGLPDQTKETLEETIFSLLRFKPKHISAYSLTIEGNTPIFNLIKNGEILETNEESYLEMEDLIQKLLIEAGYERYEISNYSLPGFRSRHNSGYWTGKQYLGLGPGASSFDGRNIRRYNPENLKGYIDRFSGKRVDKPFYEEEQLNEEERREEAIMLSLRTKEGIDLKKFLDKFGDKVKTQLERRAKKWVDRKFLQYKGDNLSLTYRGIPIADYIILDLT